MAKAVGLAERAAVGSGPISTLNTSTLNTSTLNPSPPNMAALAFWFDFASTSSYPAAMRIAPLAATAGVTIRFRPFLLGPIFKAEGGGTPPFILYPDKRPH